LDSSIEAKLKTHRLTAEEFGKIRGLLGRDPEGVEWALSSALWSEHCSYKSSKVHLKKLFNSSPRVMQSFGENAGVLDLGQGERVAFKIESHNHPSFIEPYQGAATGVGGIIRDILTMGARPVALANYLCFGGATASRHVDGVVRGIGGYGNCVGVAMVTGQTEFHESYDKNVLVNAFCLGYFGPEDKVVSSAAHGQGNLVVYVGAKTGRDGIHGARMASESFSAADESKRPNIQIGDPFFEKLLIEAFLEVVQKGLVICAQDMGAAGLISSTFEMASKGGVGFDLYLDRVPLRDPTMTPEEMLVSESQERMVLVCEPRNFAALREVFARWGLDAVEIGYVISERVMRLHWKGEILTEIDPHALVENAPQWTRPWEETPKGVDMRYFLTADEPIAKLFRALESLHGSSREWVYEQYDQQVGTQTVRDCRHSLGALRLPSGRQVGVALGGRPHVSRLNSFIGGADALTEPCLRLMMKGFTPVGASDCLNYGNPENPQVMGQFKASLDGMNEAANTFTCPLISGNVSFYNETEKRSITPTPAVSVVGLREDGASPPVDVFPAEGLNIYLVRSSQVRTNGMWSLLDGEELGGRGELDFSWLKTLGEKWLEFGRSSVACRLSGKFGLAYTLARLCLSGVGARIGGALKREDYFAERLYEAVFVTQASWTPEETPGLEIIFLGKTGGDRLSIENLLEVSVEEIKSKYHGGWRRHFGNL
jgi:phosphoribosylformylglycinamidine synthase